MVEVEGKMAQLRKLLKMVTRIDNQRFWATLGPSWGCLGAIFGCLGAIWGLLLLLLLGWIWGAFLPHLDGLRSLRNAGPTCFTRDRCRQGATLMCFTKDRGLESVDPMSFYKGSWQ